MVDKLALPNCQGLGEPTQGGAGVHFLLLCASVIDSRTLIAGSAIGGILGALLIRQKRERESTARLAAAALESLLRAIDANDNDTGAHVRRVAAYSLMLADERGVGENERRTIELAALFHDVGKIHEALFDVVREPRSLTPAERCELERHPALGADVLAPIGDFFPDLTDAVFAHHEHWDGSGYPRGLRGRRIPRTARIVALADTFDVVSYGREYQDGRAADETAAIIASGRGTQFDPELVDLMLFPPVYERLMRAHRVFVRRGVVVPERRDGKQGEKAPSLKIRWRTRSHAPAAVRARLAHSG